MQDFRLSPRSPNKTARHSPDTRWQKQHDYELNPSGRRHPCDDLNGCLAWLYYLQGKWRRLLAINETL